MEETNSETYSWFEYYDNSWFILDLRMNHYSIVTALIKNFFRLGIFHTKQPEAKIYLCSMPIQQYQHSPQLEENPLFDCHAALMKNILRLGIFDRG